MKLPGLALLHRPSRPAESGSVFEHKAASRRRGRVTQASAIAPTFCAEHTGSAEMGTRSSLPLLEGMWWLGQGWGYWWAQVQVLVVAGQGWADRLQ